MIVDCHGQVGAPAALRACQSSIFSRRGSHGFRPSVRSRDDDIFAGLNAKEIGAKSHFLREVAGAGSPLPIINVKR